MNGFSGSVKRAAIDDSNLKPLWESMGGTLWNRTQQLGQVAAMSRLVYALLPVRFDNQEAAYQDVIVGPGSGSGLDAGQAFSILNAQSGLTATSVIAAK